MSRPRSGVRPSIARELERITDSFGAKTCAVCGTKIDAINTYIDARDVCMRCADRGSPGDDEHTPLPTLDGRGAILLKRDACRKDDERLTGQTCFACCDPKTGAVGDGIIRRETSDGRYTALACWACDSTGWLSAERAAELRDQRRNRKADGR